MSNIAQVDQSDIQKLVMKWVFLKGLISENQLVIKESGDLFNFIEWKKKTNLIITCKNAGSWFYNTVINLGHIIPVITKEDVKCLGLKITRCSFSASQSRAVIA